MSKGFVTFAQNTDTVDYLRLAYLQALSVKATQKNNKFAVIVDKQTETYITDQHRKVFDYVIVLPTDNNTIASRFANEYQVYDLTPFDETIKLESDLLLTNSIDHWWNAFALKEVVLSSGCLTWEGKPATNRTYRQFFDDNLLPDVYNGLMYFRKSKFAEAFFQTARAVQDNWQTLKEQALINCREDYPSTDVLYAIVADLVGRENCTVPSMDFVKFVHMKPRINNWTDQAWTESVNYEIDETVLRINNLNQYAPVHYYVKSFASDETIKYYE